MSCCLYRQFTTTVTVLEYWYNNDSDTDNNGVNVSSNIAFIDFAELTFNSVTLTAAGAAIYKTTGGGNELVMVLDFGGNKTATNGDFVVQFPANNSTSAILRIGNA